MTDNRSMATFEFDPLNPAQYFACCGLLELASAGTPDVLAAFDHDPQQPRKARFVLYGLTPETVKTTLESLKKAKATAIGKSNGEAPIKIEIADLPKFVLDWWLAPDRSRKSRFKLWAGNQKTLMMVEDMLGAKWEELDGDFLGFCLPMSGRFGIDPRSSWNTLDFGSSPNTQNINPFTYPMTEMLAAVGLQGFHPRITKEGFSYQLWTQPLPLIPARAAASLAISEFPGSSFVFQVEKRSGSYRCFTFARPQ